MAALMGSFRVGLTVLVVNEAGVVIGSRRVITIEGNATMLGPLIPIRDPGLIPEHLSCVAFFENDTIEAVK